MLIHKRVLAFAWQRLLPLTLLPFFLIVLVFKERSVDGPVSAHQQDVDQATQPVR
jgi:hypothetical protein